MIEASYSPEGARALIKDGGSARKAAIEAGLKAAGAHLESFYFAFGAMDAFAIVDAPDNVTAAAISIATSALGQAHTKTTVLLTPEEMDSAARKSASYRPPGA
jgi:uncharacterized protein with GYD domain